MSVLLVWIPKGGTVYVVFIFTHVDNDNDDEDCSNFPAQEEPNDNREVPREPKDELNVSQANSTPGWYYKHPQRL